MERKRILSSLFHHGRLLANCIILDSVSALADHHPPAPFCLRCVELFIFSQIIFRLSVWFCGLTVQRNYIVLNKYNCVLVYKQVMGSDRLTVSLLPANQGGRLSLSLSAETNDFTTEAGFDLADNKWHDVDLVFHEDFLQIKLDGEWTQVVNASFVNRSPLFHRVNDHEPKSMTIGQGFTGCLLQGPSFPLTSIDQHLRISCPIPLGNDGEFKFLIIIQ